MYVTDPKCRITLAPSCSEALNVTFDNSEQNDEAICRRLTIPGSGVSLFIKKS